MLSLIVAASENNVIGYNNKLLWHLPKDFQRFKKITTGHPIIMGRKTFESLPGILPGRQHIIISRNTDLSISKCDVVNTLEKAIQLAYTMSKTPFIIGGGEIYKQAMEVAHQIEITRVHTQLDGDTFLPVIDTSQWKLVKEEFHAKDAKHQYDFSFLTYKKTEK